MDQDTLECLKARARTLEKYLYGRSHDRQFSDWVYYSDENLKGRLEELQNTLNMLGVKY